MPTATDINICNYAADRLGEKIVTAIDGAADTNKFAMWCSRNYARLRSEVLQEFPWSFARAKYETDSDLEDDEQQLTVTNVVETDSNTLTITLSAAHTLVVGNSIEFKSIVGATELNNNTYRVATSTTPDFTIQELASEVTAYTSGGTAQRAPLFGFEYAYVLPSDFLQDISKENEHFIYKISEGVLFSNNSDLYLNYIKEETDPGRFTESFKRCLSARLAAEAARKITGNSKVVTEMWELYNFDLAKGKQVDGFRGNSPDYKQTRWGKSRKGGTGIGDPRIIR